MGKNTEINAGFVVLCCCMLACSAELDDTSRRNLEKPRMDATTNNKKLPELPSGGTSLPKTGDGNPLRPSRQQFASAVLHDDDATSSLKQQQQRHFLSQNPICAEDIKSLCDPSILHNDFAVLDCVQNSKRTEDIDLSPECHHLLWAYKRNLTKDDRFADAAKQACGKEIAKFPDCYPLSGTSGHLLSCLMDVQENITSPMCKQILTRMESIIFSDYRLVYRFTDACDSDIERFKCGRLERNDNAPHSQGETIECLSKNPKELSLSCQHEIFRIAEIQAEDFHLDRPLFFACRNDRERLCANVVAGDGKVYRCLMHHKMDKDMSQDCREKLTHRQTLMAFDYKVNRGLSKACREDIRAYRCREDTSKNREIRLAQILICLENYLHKGYPVDGECQAEMLEHRRSLMEDFRLSPRVVVACKDDIHKFCNEKLEANGQTIHCLMEHAKPTTRKKKRITDICKRELEVLAHEADLGEDWRVDPVLKEACQPVVDILCADVKPGDGRVLSCLMDKFGSSRMTERCEDRLLEIQYFIARDVRLDPQLFRACHDDAKKYCGSGDNWADDPEKQGAERGPLLPCLFRYAYHPSDSQRLTSACVNEVQRVMRQRAVSVDLHPEIEAACINELADFCLEKVNRGEEIVCLQDNLEKLEPDCQNAIGNFTEEEAEHAELNSLLFKACEPFAKQYCMDILGKDVDQGDVMQCLLEHKNDYNMRSSGKCRAVLEHFQLISMKDFRFSYKFKEACKKDVSELCKSVRTKSEVVSCLSEKQRDDILQERKPRVSRECRQQLKIELLQRNEAIQLDPKLRDACNDDRKKFCKDVSSGNAQVLECLKDHQKSLSERCHRALFNRQREEAMDNSVDYALVNVCRRMIHVYCEDRTEDALACLTRSKNSPDFDPRCRDLVLKRMAQQNLDYRLNPRLRKACSADVRKFCSSIAFQEPSKVAAAGEIQLRPYEGRVIECLKDRFGSHRLRPSCEDEIARIVKEAQMDFRQDPILAEACKDEIAQQCGNEDPDGHGQIEECLKLSFQRNNISNRDCRRQIAKLIKEGSVDVHVDPVLFKACVTEIHKFCASIPPGRGKQLKCLLDASQSPTSKQEVNDECQQMISKRMEMYEYAIKVVPVAESVQDIVNQVSVSPSRNYFIVVGLAILGSIFIGGLFCGRVTKRIHMDTKRK